MHTVPMRTRVANAGKDEKPAPTVITQLIRMLLVGKSINRAFEFRGILLEYRVVQSNFPRP